MECGSKETISYKRAQFVTHLPAGFLYTPAHYWIARQENDLWRIGLTKFGTRMLGEMVDHGFDPQPGATVRSGQVIGWIEGFKALSDIFCIADGIFAGGNPALQEQITLINGDPYGSGWIYSVRGQPDSTCVDVHGYRAILDTTIDRLSEKQKSPE